jgi:hypothetical protein
MPIKGTFTGASDVIVNAAVDVKVLTLEKTQQPVTASAAPQQVSG